MFLAQARIPSYRSDRSRSVNFSSEHPYVQGASVSSESG